MLVKSIALSGLATVASAHIIMTNPVPFGRSSLSNGPMAANGADFPCKQRSGVYNEEGASNVYAQGSKQTLEFKGTAVHGGGSCQVSVTTDLKPTKNSVWKVIKSIEGGCPAKGQTGNMGSDANAPVPYKYDFTIPNELAAGNYTLAWTWFNKVGNREMYMNCAPLAVTGNAGSQSFMNGLPDMLVANVGNGCSVSEGTDVKFPDAGKDVDQFNGATSVFAPPKGSCGKTAVGGGNSPTSAPGGGNAPKPTSASAPPAQPTSVKPSPAVPTNGGGAPGSSRPGGIFIPTSVSPEPVPSQKPSGGNSPSAPVLSPSAPAPTSAPVQAPTSVPTSASPNPIPTVSSNAPAPVPTGGAGGDGHAPGSACSTEGYWNCIGGQSFQRCASGTWSASQGLPIGISCTPGESADLKMAAAMGKRAMRHALRMEAN
ncbi:Chitin-binding, domain 3 [Cordyceps fumosorosea ARSEF 2679]|uniref:Chitin-binding, domain 3 n=1 Tax=Cordyceps fumosorosea (strain ARSEF 2679) TaxID=1081104 RepID=A0A162JQE7_CORFA|nr:Chitin-binding, domain 3 [Cordyceps fumosorosea ARSEF 2679]OAA72252.1 Chitin-binding, domain 3 [Cordyceps fumosorosea ARSEF 2679]